MPSGWIKLHRKLQDSWIWQSNEPFDRRSAWVDLILSALHSDKKILIDNDVIMINRGSFMTSIVKLSERWSWSRGKVVRFLELLEHEQMLNTKRTPKGTLITIVKYEVFQDLEKQNDTAVNTACSTTDGATHDTQNKNIKNNKNVNKNTLCKSDALALFEELWDRYPVKKGKAQVSLAAKQRLLKVGYEEMVRAIDRYKAELEKDSNWRKPQNGSTFFNSGYIDYLDDNYAIPDEKKAKISRNNGFNQYPQRIYNFDELEKQLIKENIKKE